MKKQFFKLTPAIVLVFTLIFIIYFIYNKKHVNHLFQIIFNTENIISTDFNVELTKQPIIELTSQIEQNVPRVLDILSEEENITTTLNYTTSPKTINIPENMQGSTHFKFMDNFSKLANWPYLRDVNVPVGSLEVRVWMFLGVDQKVLRFCRHDGKWTGFYINWSYVNGKFIHEGDEWRLVYEKDIPYLYMPIFKLKPQSNWENLWEKVETLGILTLPDSSTLPSQIIMLDGAGYIVEINDGEQYRIYESKNPQLLEYPEAINFMQIIKTFRYEFLQSLPKNDWPWF